MKIEFFLSMDPPTTTAQQHKIGNGRFYDPPKLKAAKTKIKRNLRPYVPIEPFDGPLRLVVKWRFPLTLKAKDGEYKCTKPDTDNLNKMLKDIMEDLGFFVNDSRVSIEVIEKYYSSCPGIHILLETLDDKKEGE